MIIIGLCDGQIHMTQQLSLSTRIMLMGTVAFFRKRRHTLLIPLGEIEPQDSTGMWAVGSHVRHWGSNQGVKGLAQWCRWKVVVFLPLVWPSWSQSKSMASSWFRSLSQSLWPFSCPEFPSSSVRLTWARS